MGIRTTNTIQFIILPKKAKHWDTDLRQNMHDWYFKSHKEPREKIGDDLNKSTLRLSMGGVGVVMMSVIPKLTCKFNRIPSETLQGFLAEKYEFNLKCISKGTVQGQEKMQMRWISPSHHKGYYGNQHSTALLKGQMCKVGQWNRRENPNKAPTNMPQWYLCLLKIVLEQPGVP